MTDTKTIAPTGTEAGFDLDKLKPIIDEIKVAINEVCGGADVFMASMLAASKIDALARRAAPTTTDKPIPAGEVVELVKTWQERANELAVSGRPRGYPDTDELEALRDAEIADLRAQLARASLAPVSAQQGAAGEHRTCCDHPDCPTCAGRGGFYRVDAAKAPAAQAQPSTRAVLRKLVDIGKDRALTAAEVEHFQRMIEGMEAARGLNVSDAPAAQAVDAVQDRRALELANAALIAAQPRNIEPEGWKRHEDAINATNCALHKPAASPASTPDAAPEQQATDAIQFLKNVVADAAPMLSNDWPKIAELLKHAVAQIEAAHAQQPAAGERERFDEAMQAKHGGPLTKEDLDACWSELPGYAWRRAVAAAPTAGAATTREDAKDARITMLENALSYYADGHHLILAEPDAWDTVSGEPMNFLCDEAGTATVEDGTVAKLALAGDPLADDEERKVSAHQAKESE
jgi:hypothetical protein